MKLGRVIISAVAAALAVVAAVLAVVYFKDEILELLADVKRAIERKKENLFKNSEYADYADI